jgi:hypothetical protein
MTFIWIVVALAAVAALARRVVSHDRRKTELGFVSHQWLAERRSSDMSDRQR